MRDIAATNPACRFRSCGLQGYVVLPELLTARPKLSKETGRSGEPRVVYSKVIKGELYTAIFEVRAGRTTIALVSMWIRPLRPRLNVQDASGSNPEGLMRNG